MKTLRKLLGIFSFAIAVVSHAQDIAGTWSGMLPVAPDTSLEIHFVLTQAGDGYSAIITSPNPDGIRNVPATSTSFENGRLAIEVDALSGRYEGAYADGRFTGKWLQQGTEIPLVLAPYVARVLSEEGKNVLRGSWVGKLSTPQISLSIVFRFADNAIGEFEGFLDSPDQGANGIPVTDITFQDGVLELSVPRISARYKGQFDGDGFDGTFTQLGMPLPLMLTRGAYMPKGLELSQEVFEQIEGSWVGRVPNAAGAGVPIVFRFETGDDGQMHAFLDSPEQGARNIPISEVVLDQGQLSLVIPAAQASFRATFTGSEMQGSWAQGNLSQPVTMTRGEYAPQVTVLDLSAAAMQRLAGAWHGQMGPLELIIRIESTADGKPVAFLDVPAQDVSGLPVSAVSLSGDQVTVSIAPIGATLTGMLAGNEIAGQWQQGQANNPLTLVRDEAP